ncbi:MAG: hypothetical protein U0414_00290 [Polyangiaceae bacterium]
MTDERDPPDPPEEDDDAVARALIKKALAKKRAAAAEEPDLPPEVEDLEGVDQAEAPVSQAPASTGVVVDDVDLKDALRGALRPPAGAVAPNLLKGVQRKLRVRSRGKFYGDGWSTAESPKTTYLITAIIMLVLIAVLFFALVPWSSASL